MRELLRGLAPWPVRRFLRSLAEDVASLPLRLRDPNRRGDPWGLAHNVGGGDFASRARMSIALAETFGGPVRPDERVIDMGCGYGALAEGLLERLDSRGGYVGFDVSRVAIGYVRRRFAAKGDRFRFVHADVRNPEYGAHAGPEAASYRFPAEDRVMTRAVALSLFTHLSAIDSEAYVKEAARVLVPGGALIASFYLLDDPARAAIATGQARRRFVHAALGGFTNNPERPEAGIAHHGDAVAAWLAAAGLTGVRMQPGTWRAPTDGLGGQDLLIAYKT